MPARKRSTLWGPVLTVCVAALLASLSGMAWAAPSPPGNNGTVKIDDVPFDDHPNNEPHVGCVFQVDFYGFDEGDLDATVTFESYPPTGPMRCCRPTPCSLARTTTAAAAARPGGRQRDLHPGLHRDRAPSNQGSHVKLTVNAEGSQGADVKHKVFWVTGCGPAPEVLVAPEVVCRPWSWSCYRRWWWSSGRPASPVPPPPRVPPRPRRAAVHRGGHHGPARRQAGADRPGRGDPVRQGPPGPGVGPGIPGPPRERLR